MGIRAGFFPAIAAEANTESASFIDARPNRRAIGNTGPSDKVGGVGVRGQG